MDVNDHKPEFLGFSEESVREIVVEESVSIDYELGRVFAVDADSGKNGEVHYKLILNEKNDDIIISDVFNLDENTGVLRTKIELDREKRDNYKFKVINIFYFLNAISEIISNFVEKIDFFYILNSGRKIQ